MTIFCVRDLYSLVSIDSYLYRIIQTRPPINYSRSIFHDSTYSNLRGDKMYSDVIGGLNGGVYSPLFNGSSNSIYKQFGSTTTDIYPHKGSKAKHRKNHKVLSNSNTKLYNAYRKSRSKSPKGTPSGSMPSLSGYGPSWVGDQTPIYNNFLPSSNLSIPASQTYSTQPHSFQSERRVDELGINPYSVRKISNSPVKRKLNGDEEKRKHKRRVYILLITFQIFMCLSIYNNGKTHYKSPLTYSNLCNICWMFLSYSCLLFNSIYHLICPLSKTSDSIVLITIFMKHYF